MAEVALEIAGRTYPVTCRDGDEPHVRRIAELVDAKAIAARRAVGEVSETRSLLMAALLLADELDDARGSKASPPDPALPDMLERLAARVERLAERLENGAPPS